MKDLTMNKKDVKKHWGKVFKGAKPKIGTTRIKILKNK